MTDDYVLFAKDKSMHKKKLEDNTGLPLFCKI